MNVFLLNDKSALKTHTNNTLVIGCQAKGIHIKG